MRKIRNMRLPIIKLLSQLHSSLIKNFNIIIEMSNMVKNQKSFKGLSYGSASRTKSKQIKGLILISIFMQLDPP